MNDAKSEYCSTREAAQMLGLSLGTVQQMVESGKLIAWKTAGGHRRISVASVQELLRLRSLTQGTSMSSQGLTVLVAEDNPVLQKLYKFTIDSWNLPLTVKVVGNGFDGLVSIGQNQPDILVVDLLMPGIDGFDMVRSLRSNPSLNHMDIIVITGLDAAEIEARGGLPGGVTVYSKPVPFHELHGFMRARMAHIHRAQNQATAENQ
jgi:excisionase family DNA binding protein